MTSAAFRFIGRLQGDRPWGAVLDAGTGVHSAGWLAARPTASLTAVTAADAHADQVRAALSARGRRTQDRVLVGNWADPAFLAGAQFDTVLADYLVGAVDRFAPCFQEELMVRLAAATGGRLYVVGLEPYTPGGPPETAAGRLVWEIGRFRDACLLLAGEQPYREYPATWVVAQIQRAGLRIAAARRFPIRYRSAFVDSQIDMALMRLAGLDDRGLAAALALRGEALRRAATAAIAAADGLAHGQDYVIAADRWR